MEVTLRKLFVAVLFAGGLAIFGAAKAADGCGPGCHSAAYGACVVDGWGTSAVLVHLRVEPAHFDWRWRERPVLALLAWEAWLAVRWRGYAASKWSQLQRQLILGQQLTPIATSQHPRCRSHPGSRADGGPK